MSLLQGLRCRVRLHRWGPVQGDDRGGHRTCTYCGTEMRIHPDQPPDAHDHLGMRT